jgi:chitosanase
MNLTADQLHVIDCVLAIFETGRVPSGRSYSTCTILPDGAGISYGKHQATDKAGSLDAIVKHYVTLGGTHAATLQGMLPLLASNASSKEKPGGPYSAPVAALINALVAAGSDPLMQKAQDDVFARDYLAPAINHAKDIGLTKPLSLLVVYDTCIHSGPGGVGNVRRMFPEPSPARGGNEEVWVRAYLRARRNWLATHSMKVLHATVYRMDALMALVDAGAWDLAKPLTVRGQRIA